MSKSLRYFGGQLIAFQNILSNTLENKRQLFVLSTFFVGDTNDWIYQRTVWEKRR